MAFTRRTYKPRRGRKPFRRTYRKKYSRGTRRSKRGIKTTFFKRKVNGTILLSAMDTNPNMNLDAYLISTVADSAEMSSLFTMMKLCAVKVRFKFPFGASIVTLPVATVGSYPASATVLEIATKVDTSTDSTIDSSYDAFMERNPRVTQVNSTSTYHQVYFKPTLARPLYDGAIDTVYGPTRAWISSEDLTAPHYGLRYAFRVRYADQVPVTMIQPINIDVETTYYIACRGDR